MELRRSWMVVLMIGAMAMDFRNVLLLFSFLAENLWSFSNLKGTV
jgi:hypothetical protein